MNVIGNKWLFLSVSGLLVAASIIAIIVFGFKPGIDFAGGTFWQLTAAGATRETVTAALTDAGLTDATVTEEIGGDSFFIRAPELTEADHQAYLNALQEKFDAVDELRFEAIGAAIGGELKRRAIIAFFAVLLGISLYIAFAFRKVSRPVSSWKYGIITLLTLFHDALIPAGLYAVLGALGRTELDTNFIVAVLVVMGFSVHDTIVVFDRIRENLRVQGLAKKDFDTLVNESVNQTMARSINTSLTLVLVLVALFIFGAPSLNYFVLIILVGTIVGTYSSIFVASPLLTLWRKGG